MIPRSRSPRAIGPWLAIGAGVGAAIGVATSAPGPWLALGLAIGLAFGARAGLRPPRR